MTQPGSITISLRGWHWFLLGVVLTLALVSGISACYQGRKLSRLTGLSVHIKLPDDLASYDQIISISFHKNEDGETIKDVTYHGADGKVHTHEYNDWGIFQGSITWELQGR
jgi:hypothetical protein